MPRSASLPDAPIGALLPFSSHVSPTVLKTIGGDYLATWRLSGLPFVGRDVWELEHRHHAFNRLLQTLRAPDFVNVAFWVHDVRRRVAAPPCGRYVQPFHQELADRHHAALSAARLLANELYLTLVYRPRLPRHRYAGVRDIAAGLEGEQRDAVRIVQDLAAQLEAVLHDYVPCRLGMVEAGGVVFSELLTFFGGLLNRTAERVPVLSAPVHRYLATTRQQFSAKTGDFAITAADGTHQYGALLGIKEYVESTWPGILDALKYLDFEYVVTHSFSPMGRGDALRVLGRTKGLLVSSEDKALSQIAELDVAMDQLASGNFVLGEYHCGIAVYAGSREELAGNVAAMRAELSNAGFVSAREDIAAAAAFYAQFPGNWQYRTRIANVSSLNFLGLAPLHGFSGGKAQDNPWGECVAVLRTTSGQPYHFNFHATHPAERSLGEKAVANTLVIGKSGTGKTALVNFLLAQTQKLVPAPTIFFFDKDHGAEIFVRAGGGAYFSLESGAPTGFNPFQCGRTDADIQFLAGLIRLLAGKSTYSAREDEDIFRAVTNILDTPPALRSMTNFRQSLPDQGDDGLFRRLHKWTAGHTLGWVFDNPVDRVDLGRATLIGFDYTAILDHAEVRVPVIHYLLHRLESLIDGRRLIYVMDEFWKILDGGGGLKDFARNKQKTIRKQNGFGIFATQSPEDALRSDLAATLVEQAATLILLPNPRASRADYMDGLKLTEAEYRIVASLDERSRCFMVKQGGSSVVCRLDLRGMEDLLAVLSASTGDIGVLHDVLRRTAGAAGVGIDDLSPGAWLPAFHAQRAAHARTAASPGNPQTKEPSP